jgi:hypothetical protein
MWYSSRERAFIVQIFLKDLVYHIILDTLQGQTSRQKENIWENTQFNM